MNACLEVLAFCLSFAIMNLIVTGSIHLSSGCNLHIKGSCTHYYKTSGNVIQVVDAVSEQSGDHYRVYWIATDTNQICTITSPEPDPNWHVMQPVDALVDTTTQNKCQTIEEKYNYWYQSRYRV
jgi:hypothetical protein